jgi:uncharacterized repeat protein (TIGR01451 family)
MVKSRFAYLLLCLTLLLSLAGGFAAISHPALAQSPSPTSTVTPTPAPDLLSLETDIPSYKDNSGATFNFNVTIKYNGTDRQTINLSASTSSPGWTASVSYSGKQTNSIDIGPASSYGPDTKSVQLNLIPPPNQKPDPGKYVATLSVTAGSVTETIDLTGEVNTKYSFSMTSDTGRLSTSATAGQDNHYSVTLTNSSSVPLTNITFSSSKPDNWTIKYNPEKVDSIDANSTKQIDVVIIPPSGKTIAGDYMITLTASNDKVNSSLDIRVTALTPSIWGWVGIIIVVVVVAGLGILFLRLGRR